MPSKQAIIDNVQAYEVDDLVNYVWTDVVGFDDLCNETGGAFNEKKEGVRLSLKSMIMEQISSLSPERLAQYVLQGVVTIEELKTESSGNFARGRRKKVEEIVERNREKPLLKPKPSPKPNHTPDSNARPGEQNRPRNEETLKSLMADIKRCETDSNVLDVQGKIFNTIVEYLNRKENKIECSDLIGLINDDNNIFSSYVVGELLEKQYITYRDLKEIGIKETFLDLLRERVERQEFNNPEPIDRINKSSTEVYFWGIPSSGKSCALGAILSVAANGSIARTMIKDNDCQGYGYMTRLSALFRKAERACRLPEGTSIYSTYEMGFDLVDMDHKIHPITCVDLAGELVRCMYKFDAKEQMTDDEKNALDTVTNILIENRSISRKIHFFVLEYGAEDRSYQGLTQSEYLDAACAYIKRTKIFEKDTDAIFLLITKVDKVRAGIGNLQDKLKKYIEGSYLGFYNGLTEICKKNEINKGLVEIIPFSLGEVCFQDYCLFNDKPASRMVNKLLERTIGYGQGIYQRMKKKLAR